MRYVDPDGNEIINADRLLMQSGNNTKLGKSKELITKVGCVLTAYTRMANALIIDKITLEESNKIGVKNNLFTGKDGSENLLTPKNGAALVNAILKENGIDNLIVSYEGSYIKTEAIEKYKAVSSSEEKYFATVRVNTHDVAGNKYDHTMNLDSNSYVEGACGDDLKFNDTSGVRTHLVDDPSGRKSIFIRMDFFKITEVKTVED